MTARSFRRLTRSLLAAVCLVSAASVGAAQTAQTAPDAAEQKIRQRVEDYWKARATMVLQSVYPFHEPAFRAK